jgi:hypothetical protein
VAEQVDGDHAVVAYERRHHPLPPIDRAGEAVDEDDRRRLAGAAVDDLDLAAAQAQDPPVGPGRLGPLRLGAGDERVDAEHDRQGDD